MSPLGRPGRESRRQGQFQRRAKSASWRASIPVRIARGRTEIGDLSPGRIDLVRSRLIKVGVVAVFLAFLQQISELPRLGLPLAVAELLISAEAALERDDARNVAGDRRFVIDRAPE